MTQKAIKVGDSIAVVLPKKSLKGLGIVAGTELDVEVNQQSRVVSIRPTAKLSKRQERIAKLTYNFINRYRKDLESLADK